jgi:hypothetical protein
LLIGLSHRETFLANYLNPLLKKARLKRTVPGSPAGHLQHSRTTGQGMKWVMATPVSASLPIWWDQGTQTSVMRIAIRRRHNHPLGRPVVADGEIHLGPVGRGEVGALLGDEAGGG